MRIISMVPSWTETFLQCGVDVVGRTRFCIHPSELVKNIAVVGGTKDINWEKAKALGADAIVLDKEENPRFMAEESPLPVITTHIRGIIDVQRDCTLLAEKLRAPKLAQVARRWQKIRERPIQSRTILEIPGIIEWIQKPSTQVDQFIYLIWNKPWMAVSRHTFIGSVFENLGLGQMMVNFDRPYPEIELEKFDPAKTLLLASSEPYPFAKKKDLLRSLPFSSALVDGEAYSWFGVRSLEFLENQN